MNTFEKIDINEENNITKEDLFNFEIEYCTIFKSF